jgi:hypothetical protein
LGNNGNIVWNFSPVLNDNCPVDNDNESHPEDKGLVEVGADEG